MPVLKLFTSNRMETLADQLARVLETPLSSPFDTETIIVQSRGMERWISLGLAERHGICANIRFPFPNTFLAETIETVLTNPSDTSFFDPRIMTWKVMKLLPSLLHRQGFKPLLTYLENTESQLKRFQLSERIADLFDQYLLFRPEMIRNWEKGREDHWQAVLWQELVKGHEHGHRAFLGGELISRLNSSETFSGLPERISVFGISTLPRFHMEVFVALSRHIPVYLFLMNPCQEYWAQITSDRDMERILRKDASKDIPAEDLHLDPGNSLLASMGALGAEFFDLINGFTYDDHPFFEDPEDPHLLARIQSDILNLRERGQPSGAQPAMEPDVSYHKPLEIAPDDRSIQIHSCHSPMREVEVLRDNLLSMFQNDPELLPKDILVMTPDIEAYAPFIEAVFDVPLDSPWKIPYSIADQSIRAQGKIIQPFTAILKLAESRLGVFQVMSILDSRAVMDRFGLSEKDVVLIRKWVTETGIRWGMDAGNRAEMGLPALSENTWRAGLERLVLGYAMPGNGEAIFNGILPFDNMEGDNTQILGRFLEFTDQVFGFVQKLRRTWTPEEWSVLLKDMLESFFLPDEDLTHEVQIIQRTLYQLAEQTTISGFDEQVDLQVIGSFLDQRLKKEGFGFGFITGGVTFCAMLPMRSIPFQVICLMGLNNNAYPRQSNPLGFDLMSVKRRKGEPLRQHDDRYLFLEALLSARKLFYISYVGQSYRDNTPISPSVVVSELMDHINQGFVTQKGVIQNHLLVAHRLQPFSPEYFKENSRLFSYSHEQFETACCLTEARHDPTPFLSEGLPVPDEEWNVIDVDGLCRFFNNPSRFFLQKRLQINPEEGSSILEETEPFVLEGLEKYYLAQDMLVWRLEGKDLCDFYPKAQAKGLLPHGVVGKTAYERIQTEIEVFAEKIRVYISGDGLGPVTVDLKINEFHLKGLIQNIHSEHLFRYRYATVKPGDLISNWIYHLILNCVSMPGFPKKTIMAGLEKGCAIYEFMQMDTPDKILENLLKHYWEGLCRPIHFFPKSSLEYATMILEKNRSNEDAIVKAKDKWTGNMYIRGEMEDPNYQLCFRGMNPFDPEFEDLALDLWGPLLAHKKKIG